MIMIRQTAPTSIELGSQIGYLPLPCMIIYRLEPMRPHIIRKITHSTVACRKFLLKDLKKDFNDLCDTCKNILSEVAHISWASGGHSNGYVPVYAIGPGTEVFQGRIDNIEIAPAMAKIAGYNAE